MKPQHLNIINIESQSFNVRKDFYPNINNRWHYHKQLELITFHKGTGTQFVGDNIRNFGPGDVVLIGRDLPHYWKYDNCFLNDKDNQTPYSTVIHFFENFLGDRFLMLPEVGNFRSLLEMAKRGILIKADDATEIATQIEAIYASEGIVRIIRLLECLNTISKIPTQTLLTSIGFKQDFKESENERMDNIYNFVISNFKNKIELDEVASIAGMSVSSFCRYFKMRTGKTFMKFLADMRVGYACKLILDNKLNMKSICHESGFNNFSCLHKNFKIVTGMTPKDYRHHHNIK
ncbi:AraC family transcriptional regulator [Pedobacter rhodius]|uniref:AraC family transcriptional regulator n=1 Tax=Pedobacter rhodius TaxID=3004098 RepID=A0ABT4KUG1_9SPHI|nr:AraC family transcriptional regulator [Pedobacter sp. SJ11]MCZ4222578.1 AraC family transcriptional regulator [Pedobacter sp. SJ11]